MLFLKENDLDVETYLQLRSAVNWVSLDPVQAERALNRSLYIVTVYDEDKAVGMGRLVGDGAVISYIQDLIVVPEYQGKKIGSKIIDRLISRAEELRMPGTVMMLDLMCAKGREQFYEKHGFIARPTDTLGPGMIQYLKDK
ncbi:MAG: GNAT family N-acetyltransferase [Eubacterium sp.]|nr:GNAT family N-acetyltransferase [Eubacterium sp.]